MKKIVLLLSVIALWSCSSSKTTTAETKTVADVAVLPELAEGKSLYENNCAKCHKLFNPKDFSAEEWKPIVLKMQKKAKIDDATREKIYAYLSH